MTDLDYAQAHVRQLVARVKELEKELERKDEMQVLEIRTMRDQLLNIIKTHKLD